MTGEVWRQIAQVGKETQAGIVVPATRRVYGSDVTLTRDREPRTHQFATGTRDNVRAVTLGPVQAGGGITIPVGAGELIEWLLCGVKGNVTPTVAGATSKLWTFKAGGDIDSMTIERNDGARLRSAAGVRVNSFSFTGNVNEMNTCTMELFGTELYPLGALTAGPTERTPEFYEGWESLLYIDNFGGTPGITNIPGTMYSWEVTLNNNLGRKYAADNTLAALEVTTGIIEITANIVLWAETAAAQAEFDNWDANTYRLVRLLFGNNKAIDAGTNEVQTLTITGSPTGGTFTITYSAQTTAPIPWNATAQQVQSALTSLSNIGNYDVRCTGGPLPGTPVVITFQGLLKNTNVTLMTTTDSLTGGTTPSSAIVETTPGVVGYNSYVALDIPGAWGAVDLNQEQDGARCYQFNLSYVYDAALATGLQILCQNNRATAF